MRERSFMSADKERYEARRRLETAGEDLDAARTLMESGRFSHSCFFSRQAGEKALKALWFFLEEDPWGHSIDWTDGGDCSELVALEKVQHDVQESRPSALESSSDQRPFLAGITGRSRGIESHNS